MPPHWELSVLEHIEISKLHLQVPERSTRFISFITYNDCVEEVSPPKKGREGSDSVNMIQHKWMFGHVLKTWRVFSTIIVAAFVFLFTGRLGCTMDTPPLEINGTTVCRATATMTSTGDIEGEILH